MLRRSVSRYVALLRGINVGGRNLIKMAALKACFEETGMEGVTTYIQSGNVVFTSTEGAVALTRRLEDALEATFGTRVSVMLRTRKQLQALVARAPAGFGEQPARYRYDVLFLRAPLTAAAVMKRVDALVTPGVDAIHAGRGAVYFSRLISKAAQSRLGRLTSMPIYQDMTIRNWATTTTLLRMASEGGP
jgi:uncharacterized protein (DUF1697 family)